MARMPRLNLENVPQHVVQRGNNRQVTFVTRSDYVAYLESEFDESKKVETSKSVRFFFKMDWCAMKARLVLLISFILLILLYSTTIPELYNIDIDEKIIINTPIIFIFNFIETPFSFNFFKVSQKKKSQSVWRTATKTTSNEVAIRAKQIGGILIRIKKVIC